jgi:mannosyl-3-phosphoglycerate phosphatase
MKQNSGKIIYTCLDGALLDEKDCSFQESLPALRAARERGFHVVFCSTKTRAEIEHVCDAMEMKAPFIAEGGGAIHIPEEYFPFEIDGSSRYHGYAVIEFGESYWKVVEKMRAIRSNSHDLSVVGFSDLTIKDVALEYNMTYANAKRAKDRAHSELFRFRNATKEACREFLQKVTHAGLRYSNGSRLYRLHGAFDTGKAIRALNLLFRRTFDSITTVGIGHSPNDSSMLGNAEHPMIVKQPSGTYHPELAAQFPRAQLTDGTGPQGLAEAVMQLVNSG